MPRFLNFHSRCRTSFILVFSQRTILLTHASEQTCALKTFSEIDGQQAFLRRKESFEPFSVAPVLIVKSFILFFFFFFIFNLIVSLFTRCEKNENCWYWLQNNCFFARKQLLELDLTEASKTNPYVQFSVFSNDLPSLICLNEVPRVVQLLKIAKWWIMAWLRSLQLIFCY